MRIIFMGTPEFSVPALKALAHAHDVISVYTQPPRPAGRGKQPRPSPVQEAAEALSIPVACPVSLKAEEEKAAFAALNADVAVVAAYGLILPKAVLAAPKHGCINIHASLLPRWRGAAPIQRAIMAGDKTSGITIMQMEAGLDTGPMLLKDPVRLSESTTAGDLHDLLAERGADLIVEALAQLEAGALPAEPQLEDGITYAHKIDKAEAKIDFVQPADHVRAHIHGLSPFPGAYVELAGERIKLLRVEQDQSVSAEPGLIIDDRLTIACADGAVRPVLLQRAGKQPMEADAFLRGFTLPSATKLA